MLPFLPGSYPESIEPWVLQLERETFPALRTGLGGFLVIDIGYRHSGKDGLVLDKRGQLPKVPARHHAGELLGAFDPFPDTH